MSTHHRIDITLTDDGKRALAHKDGKQIAVLIRECGAPRDWETRDMSGNVIGYSASLFQAARQIATHLGHE